MANPHQIFCPVVAFLSPVAHGWGEVDLPASEPPTDAKSFRRDLRSFWTDSKIFPTSSM